MIRVLRPRIEQRLSLGSLGPLVRRWPMLARLLGAKSRIAAAAGTLVNVEDLAPSSERTPDALHESPEAQGMSVALIARLRDPSAEVAMEAVTALRDHPSDAVVAALRAVLANEDGFYSASTRGCAIGTLGALLPAGDGAMIASAVADRDAEVSVAAIAALVERNDSLGVDVLTRVLTNEGGFYLPITRRASARGLLRLEPAWDARLDALLATETDDEVRESLSALALGRRGS